MKKSLHLLPLFTTFVVPGSLGLELAGVDLSSTFSLAGAFSVAVAGALVTIAFADYAGGRRARTASAALVADTRAPHPLAA